MGSTRLFLLLLAGAMAPAAACEQHEGQPVLPDETVARIMADLYVAEAATTGLGGYSRDSLMHIYYGQVFDIHQVTREQYEKDLLFRARDEAHMEEVVDAAIALLQPEADKKEQED
ncbi:MAG: DUF4296 domain-containing protein [Lewinellaceae bacterium]|nr:DUF4296 domain-containing protein [Lewinellaceae bacterium]